MKPRPGPKAPRAAPVSMTMRPAAKRAQQDAGLSMGLISSAPASAVDPRIRAFEEALAQRRAREAELQRTDPGRLERTREERKEVFSLT